jgi:hypothetical protein
MVAHFVYASSTPSSLASHDVLFLPWWSGVPTIIEVASSASKVCLYIVFYIVILYSRTSSNEVWSPESGLMSTTPSRCCSRSGLTRAASHLVAGSLPCTSASPSQISPKPPTLLAADPQPARQFVAICITGTKFKFFEEKMSGRGGKDTTTTHHCRKQALYKKDSFETCPCPEVKRRRACHTSLSNLTSLLHHNWRRAT